HSCPAGRSCVPDYMFNAHFRTDLERSSLFMDFSLNNATPPRTSARPPVGSFARLIMLMFMLMALVVPGAALVRGTPAVEGAPGAPPDPAPHDLTALQAATPTWQAQYFANPNLTGAPVLTRADAAIDFDWGAGSP